MPKKCQKNKISIREKKKAGRKTSYSPDKNRIAESLCEEGLTDKQIARFFGVTEQTINNWKSNFPLFFESLKRGKQLADSRVEAALFQKAVGYSVPDVHISSYEGKVTITPIIKHYPPDSTSCIFWLKNRDPKRWRDKQEIEHSGEIATPALVVNVK